MTSTGQNEMTIPPAAPPAPQYRELLDAIDEGYCVVELLFDDQGAATDYRFIETNRVFNEQSGLEDVLGRTMRELHPALESYWYEIYGRVATTGEPVRIVERAQSLGRWFDVYAFRVGVPAQHKVAVLFRDVTERLEQQNALRDAQARAQLASELTRHGTFRYDAQRYLADFDDRMREIWGLPADQTTFSLAAVLTRIHPEDRERVAAAVQAAVEPDTDAPGSGRYDHVYRVIWPDGSERWVQANGLTQFRGEGAAREPVQMIGTALDITEHKRIERALSESDERQTLLLNLSDALRPLTDPVQIQATAAQLVAAHMKLTRAHYFEVRHENGRAYYQIHADYHRPGLASLVGRVRAEDFGSLVAEGLQQGRTIAFEDAANEDLLSRDERAAFAAVNVRAFIAVPLIHEGRYVGGFAVHQDSPRRWNEREISLVREVTERTNNAVVRARADESLRRTEERQSFLLRLSDALRPLDDPIEIQHAAAALLGGHLGANRVGYAEHVGQDHIEISRSYTHGVPKLEGRFRYADYGVDLMRDLQQGLTVVRPDVANDPTLSDVQKRAHAALQIGAYVGVPQIKNGKLSCVVFMHHAQARAYTPWEIELLRDVTERVWDAMHRARADTALRQADARRQAFLGELAHDLRNPLAPMRNALALLKRGGPNIDPERMHQMLERQLDQLVRVVDTMSEFTRAPHTLPADALQPIAPGDVPLPADPPTDAAAASPRHKVLVVDDEPDAADSTGLLLNTLGAEVRVVNDGVAALAQIDVWSPDIVLLDLAMPGLDGYEVARRVHAVTGRAQPLLVALTGWGQTADRARTSSAGFRHHFVKPASATDLSALLAGLHARADAPGHRSK